MMDVDINFLPGDNNVTEEHLLRRLLYLGTVESALSLRGGCNKKGKQRFNLTQVGNQNKKGTVSLSVGNRNLFSLYNHQ